MSDDLLIHNAAGVVTITINRPARRNAVTFQTVRDLLDAARTASQDPACRVLVLAGFDGAFCSGADLTAGTPDLRLLEAAAELVSLLPRLPQPVIAAVPGLCVGIGVSFALAADLVVATESAYFLLSFTDIALMPDGGATAFVPASVGRARAMSMALAPERLPAQRAHEWGLIHRVVPDHELTTAVTRLAWRLAGGSREALAATKQAVNSATLGGLPAALDREAIGQGRLVVGADFAEARAAFAAKRRPIFG